jgi:hypothetical protein
VTARPGWMRWVTAGAATVLATVLLARASAAPLPFHSASAARIRLSWSARPERIEVCRTLSAEELAQRAEHMRQRVECEGRFATYALRVTVDGRPAGEDVVRGAGLRNDRPLYLLREFELAPGAHAVRVTFMRRETTDDDAAAFAPAVSPGVDTGLYAGRAEREAGEHARRAGAAIPPNLTFDSSLTFAPRQLKLITFDAERRALRVLAGTNRRGN